MGGVGSLPSPLHKEVRTMTKWEIYEEEKKRIKKMGLSQSEYEKAIRNLCKKLKI